MAVVLHIAVALYGLNMLVGLAAKLRGMKFGVWHHVLYAVVFAAAIAATVFAWRPALLVTLAALAAMPWVSARTGWHPALAVVGFGGYLLALLI